MTEAATSSATEWYIITDDEALTLRITPGLTLGETANGELALGHRDASAQWVRFDPTPADALTLARLDDQASLELDDVLHDDLVEVAAGTLIQLPNNRLRISNHFRGQDRVDAVLRISHRNATQGPPLLTTGSRPAVPTPSGSMLAARPAQGPSRAPSRSRETGGTTAAASAPGKRSFDSALRQRRDRVGSLLDPLATNPTEEALVPVSAEAPFADEDFRSVLEQPIDLRDTTTSAIPTLTTTATPQVPAAGLPERPHRRNLTVIGITVGIALFGLLSVLLAVTLNQRENAEATVLPPVADQSLVLLPVPDEQPAEPQVQRPTEALLRSVDKVIAEGDATDISVWDFAIRSYEFVLAQEPDNAAARLRLQEAQQTLAALKAGASPPAQTLPDPGASSSVVSAIAEANESESPSVLTPAQSDALDLAEERLEFGQAISPSSAAAVPLILGVLRDNPTAPRAINLLNRSADLLLREAEVAWMANNQYLARNILEEVFAFHPRHAEANRRWTDWTGQPPRVPPATSPAAD